jgi:hypothetical protein
MWSVQLVCAEAGGAISETARKAEVRMRGHWRLAGEPIAARVLEKNSRGMEGEEWYGFDSASYMVETK